MGEGERRSWRRGAYCCLSSRAVRTLRLVSWASRSLHSPTRGRSPAQPADRAEEEEDLNLPVQFSSSKAAPVRWKVDHSRGKQKQRPWWKVLPFTLTLMVLIMWCFLRQESNADKWLGQVLGEEDEEESDGRPDEPEEAPVPHGART